MDSLMRAAARLTSPLAVQRELYTWPYNKKNTLRSAARALEMRTGHCMEAAHFAAAVLEPHGYDPLIMSFESQDGLDHIIYVFQGRNALWGAIGRSRDQGLHGRKPIFKTLEELAKSYLDPYVDLEGRITAYEVFHLDETLTDWRRAKGDLWRAESYLLEAKHRPLNMPDARYRKLLAAYKRRGAMPRQNSWWTPRA